MDDVHKTTWRSLFAFTAKGDLSTLIVALFLTAISGAARPTLAIFIGKIFDQLGRYQSGSASASQLLGTASIWCLAITILGVGLGFINGSFFSLFLIFGERQARSVREKLFHGILLKSMDWFDLRSDGIGALLIRVQTQIRELQSGNSQALGFVFEDLATILAGLGIAFFNSWSLSLVVLATIPLIAIAVHLPSRGLQESIEQQKTRLDYASKLANTAITSIDTVKAFNGEDEEVDQYSAAITAQVKPYLNQARINALQMGISKFGATAMFAISFWYALALVRKGLTGGKVITTIYSVIMASQAAEAILPQWLILAKGMSAGATLKSITEEVEHGRRISKMDGASRPIICRGEVEFRRITFAYPSNPNQLAMIDVDFFFKAKQTTFVVGRSGSGKSTLSNLLLKFYDPLKGSVLLDGFPIQTLDTEWLRNNITLVQQQSTLFDETLFRNIAFGRRSHEVVSKADVIMASQTAVLQETISDLPEGLDTMVGATGNSLSGGQKQRIAIARARLRDSAVLVLDEATSALDPESRSLVMEAIRTWRQGKTTIIITHDISQILPEDFIYVLEGGKVVQEGIRTLIQDHGAFRSFVSQSDVDPANPFGNHAEIRKPRSLSMTPVRSVAGSVGTSRSSEGFDPDAVLPEGYLSKFLSVGNLRQAGHNNRMSLGVGIGATYASVLRGESAWDASDGPSQGFLSTPHPPSHLLLQSSDSRTFPLRPSYRKIDRLSRQYLAEETQSGFELMELRGQTTQDNRPPAGSRTNRSPKGLSRASTMAVTHPGRFSIRKDLDPPNKSKLDGDGKPPKRHVAELKEILGSVPATLNTKARVLGILGFIFCAISSACTPAFAYTFSLLEITFNEADSKQQSTDARKWALTILAIATLDGISTFLWRYLLEYVAVIWVTKLRVQALQRILAQPKSWFGKPSSTPEKLNECLDRNAEEMRNIVGRFSGMLFYAGFMMTIGLVWALAVCWKLVLVTLPAVPFVYLFSRIFEAVSSKWERRLDAAASHSGAVFAETFSNIRVVRAFTLESYFKIKLRHAARLTYRVGYWRAVYTGIFFGMNDCTTQFIQALVLYYGCVVATSHQWSVKDVIAVMTLLLFSATSAAGAIGLIPQIGQARATANFMLYLANLPRNTSHEARGIKRIESPFPVQLTDLNFSYPSTKDHQAVQVLNDVNIKFDAGTSTAIVGPSGCGKSTIASLLLGLYPPTERSNPRRPAITFAGNSVAALHMPTLRSHMAIVPQQPVLFPTTVANNISYGLQNSSSLNTRLNVVCAAQAAGIHDTIVSLPQGYETQIGDGGQGLSGGQAQRVAIARALIRRPRILILDEATSALDAESSRGIRDLVEGLVKRGREEKRNGGLGLAVVVMTHAVEMMRIVDRVIMLEAGRVVEEGNFEELMKQRGRFAKLVRGGTGVC